MKKRASKSVKEKGLGESNIESPQASNETKTSQPKQHVFWVFTMFDYLERENEIKEWLINNCVKAVYGHEICPTSQKEHLQGYFHLKRRKRLTEIQNKPITWSYLAPCYADEYANNKYCSKDGNDIFNHPFKRKPVRIISELRPFQIELRNRILQEPDDRKIIWIADLKGGHGKTAFCRYLIHHHNACYITEGKKSDIINIVYNHCLKAELDLVVINVPRENNKISYKVLEELKDGIICNTKYETGTELINPPHIIVFCNFFPEYSKFTADRWEVYTINDNNELISSMIESDT